MKKLIIIEGNDNSGKDTLIHGLENHLNNKDCKVYHSIAPKSKNPKDAAIEQWNFFIKMIDDILIDKESVIILNRAWQGEYVYGCLYRGRNENDVIKDIEYLDKLTQEYMDVYYVQLIADPIVLKNNEDGLSISQGKLDKIENEKQLFIEMFNHSKINKVLVEVTENGNYRSKDSIFKQVINFIENDK